MCLGESRHLLSTLFSFQRWGSFNVFSRKWQNKGHWHKSHSVFQKLVISEAFQPVALRWTGKHLFVCLRVVQREMLLKYYWCNYIWCKTSHVPCFYLCIWSVYQVPGTFTSAVPLESQPLSRTGAVYTLFLLIFTRPPKSLTLFWKRKSIHPSLQQ